MTDPLMTETPPTVRPPHSTEFRRQFPLYLPGILLLIATCLLEFSGGDLRLSGRFYSAASAEWTWLGTFPWKQIDRYFVYPGMLLGIVATAYAAHCLVWRMKTRWTLPACIVAGTFLLGPGLLVNGSMKPFFSRPRPKEVVELGGVKAYRPPLGFGEQVHFNSSFPCGHASIGFFLIAPAFACRRHSGWQAAWLYGGLAYGTLMGVSRIVQGAHYTSDVLWSLGVVYYSAWFCTALCLRYEATHTTNIDQTSPPVTQFPSQLAA